MVSTIRTGYESLIAYTETPASAAVIYCSDGRLGEHIDEFMADGLGITDFDRLAIPGGAACLAGHWQTWREEEALATQLRFLVEAHPVRRVILIAHQDCGHYLQRLGLQGPTVSAQQRADLSQAARRVRRLAHGLQVEAYLAGHNRGRLCFLPITPQE